MSAVLDTAGMADLIGVKSGRVSMLLTASRRKAAAGKVLAPEDIPLPTEVRKGRPYWSASAGAAWKARREAAGVGRGGARGGGRPRKSADAVTVRLVVEYRGRRAQVSGVDDRALAAADRADLLAQGLARQAGALLRNRLTD